MIPDMHTLHAFIDWLIRASWQASVVAGLVLLAQWLFRNRLPGRWRHALWLLVVLRLIIPALPTSHTSIFRVVPPAPTSEFFPPLVPREGLVVITAAGSAAPTIGPGPIETKPLDWRLTFAACWAGVAGLLALRLILTNLAFVRRIAEAHAVDDPAALALLDDCRTQMRVRQPVTLLETHAVSSPAVIGAFRPRLLLPPGLTGSLTPQELRFVFLHEMAHIRRHDLALNWLLAIVRILHWFNPVIWLAVERCRADRELACDEMVLSSNNTVPQEEYGMTIIKLVQNVSGRAAAPGSIGIVENKAELRRRIARIAAFDRRTMRWSLLGLALVLVLSSVALTETAPRQPAASAISVPSAPAAPQPATAPVPTTYYAPTPFDPTTQPRTYSISDVLKDPHYLIREPAWLSGTGPGGFSPLALDDAARRAPASLPAGDVPVPPEDLPKTACKAPEPTPQERAELRHRAALALVDLVREKMLSLHANSPEAIAHWQDPEALRLWPTEPDVQLQEEYKLTAMASPVDAARIASLLADLREDSRIKIAVEARFIAFPAFPLPQASRGLASLFKRPDNDWKKFLQLLPKEALESTTLQPDGRTHRPGIKSVFMDDKQLEKLLSAVKADPRCITLTMPRVTLRNNQDARVEVVTSTAYVAELKKVTDEAGNTMFKPRMDQVPTGTWIHVCTAASRDRKSIQVKWESNTMRLVSLVDVWHDEARRNFQMPVTWQCRVEETVAIPNNQTQVLVSQEMPDDPRDAKGPKQLLIVLITPRIIAASSE